MAKKKTADTATWRRFQNVYGNIWCCSNCSFVSLNELAPKLYKHCPHCGAKMEDEIKQKCINCNYYCESQLKGGFNIEVTIEPLTVQDDRMFYPFDLLATKADPEHFGFKSSVCLKHGIQLKPEAVGCDNNCRFWKLKGGK